MVTTRRGSLVTLVGFLLIAAAVLLLQHAPAVASPTAHAGTLNDPIPIRIGETVRAVLPDGPGVVHQWLERQYVTAVEMTEPEEVSLFFELDAGASGAVTFDLRSLVTDTKVKLLQAGPDDAIEFIYEYDDSAGTNVGTQEVLTVEARPGVRHLLEVYAVPEWGGEIELLTCPRF